MSTHIKLPKDKTYTKVITCGSPERAEFFSSFIDMPKIVAKNREYHSYSGFINNEEILIISHGIGSAGAAICFQELIDMGAEEIIRIGTAGALYNNSNYGDIILPLGSIRKDGVSRLMIPLEYPAIPDRTITNRIESNLKDRGINYRAGITLTSDLFYPGLIENCLELFKTANALAVEMECSTLFIISSLRNVKASSLLVIDGEPLNWKNGKYNPSPQILENAITNCFHSAVAALIGDKK
jgi:uridine phosphorylase